MLTAAELHAVQIITGLDEDTRMKLGAWLDSKLGAQVDEDTLREMGVL